MTLHVNLVTDLVPTAEFNAVEVVLTRDGSAAGSQLARAERRALETDAFVRGAPAASFSGLVEGPLTIRLTLLDAEGARVASVLRHLALSRNTSTTLTIERSCVDVVCPQAGNAAATSCRAGRCVEPHCADDDDTNDDGCPADAFCVSAADCDVVDACAAVECLGRRCLATPRPSSCEDGDYCHARLGCMPVTPPPPPPERPCNTVCPLDEDGCLFGYLRCIDAQTTVCSELVRRPVGTLCTSGGVCDERGVCIVQANDGGVAGDGSTSDAAQDATQDAATEAGPSDGSVADMTVGVDASEPTDAAGDAGDGDIEMGGGSLPVLRVESVGATGLDAYEPIMPRTYTSADEETFLVDWFTGGPQFEFVFSAPTNGPVRIEVTSEDFRQIVPGPCDDEADDGTFDGGAIDGDTFTIGILRSSENATTPVRLCPRAYFDLQRDGDQNVVLTIRISHAPADTHLIGWETDFTLVARDVDRLHVATRPMSLFEWDGWEDHCPTSTTMSGDGAFIAYASKAYDPEAFGTISESDYAGQIALLPAEPSATPTIVTVDSEGAPGNGLSFEPALSRDGRFLAFMSAATNFVDLPPGAPEGAQAFVLDRATGEYLVASGVYDAGVLTEVADEALETSQANSPRPFNAYVAISGDGRFVAFSSRASNLVAGVPGGDPLLYVFDRVERTTVLASRDTGGAPREGFIPSLSFDGRLMAFASNNTSPNRSNVYVRDLVAETTSVMDVLPGGAIATQSATAPKLSENGEWVVMLSTADLTGETPSSPYQMYRRRIDDPLTMERISAATDTNPIPGYYGAISEDGARVLYGSMTTVGANEFLDATLWNAETGAIDPISALSVAVEGWGSGNTFVNYPVAVVSTSPGRSRVLLLSKLFRTSSDDACRYDVAWGDFGNP